MRRSPQNCVQQVTFGGTITGGTVNLAFPGQQGLNLLSNTGVVYSATSSVMIANLQAAFDQYFGPGQTVVALVSAGVYSITYSGNLVADTDIVTPTAINNLTGTSPTFVVAQTTQGLGGLGFYEPYVAGSNLGYSYAILEMNTRTSAGGNILDEHGDTGNQTAEAYISGYFSLSSANTTVSPTGGGILQLPGADTFLFPSTGSFGNFGKIVSGQWNTYPTLYPGTVVAIPGP